jgi:hypothetical protein
MRITQRAYVVVAGKVVGGRYEWMLLRDPPYTQLFYQKHDETCRLHTNKTYDFLF